MRHPWSFKRKDCNELINKFVKIIYKDGTKEREIQGVIKECLLSSNFPHIPVYLTISLEKVDKDIYFINMIKLEILSLID